MDRSNITAVSGRRLSFVAAILSLASSLGGLLVPGIYRETAWAIPQMQGQDALTVLFSSSLLILLWRPRQRVQHKLVCLGLLGYLWYTYVGASFAYSLNPFHPIYIAAASTSSFAIAELCRSIDPESIARMINERVPVTLVRRALIGLAALLGSLWLSQLTLFIISGAVPEGVRLGGNGFIYPYVLDLGVIVPLCMLSAQWLKRGSGWGIVAAGALLIKAAAMGLALVAMSMGLLIAGFEAPIELFGVWILIAIAGTYLSFKFIRPLGAA